MNLSMERKFKQNRVFIFVYWILTILFTVSLFFYMSVKAVFDIYGQINITPVLFRLAAGGENGVPWNIVKLFIPWVLRYLLLTVLIFLVAWSFLHFETVADAGKWIFKIIGKIPGFGT